MSPFHSGFQLRGLVITSFLIPSHTLARFRQLNIFWNRYIRERLNRCADWLEMASGGYVNQSARGFQFSEYIREYIHLVKPGPCRIVSEMDCRYADRSCLPRTYDQPGDVKMTSFHRPTAASPRPRWGRRSHDFPFTSQDGLPHSSAAVTRAARGIPSYGRPSRQRGSIKGIPRRAPCRAPGRSGRRPEAVTCHRMRLSRGAPRSAGHARTTAPHDTVITAMEISRHARSRTHS